MQCSSRVVLSEGFNFLMIGHGGWEWSNNNDSLEHYILQILIEMKCNQCFNSIAFDDLHHEGFASLAKWTLHPMVRWTFNHTYDILKAYSQ